MLLGGKRAIQLRGFEACLFQLVHLIFHQRDERRYDDGRARQMQ